MWHCGFESHPGHSGRGRAAPAEVALDVDVDVVGSA
jgi:hypothetical protein